MKAKHTRSLHGPEHLKVDAEERTVEGYASVFGVLDNHGDIVDQGAFSESLSSLKSPKSIPLLYQHDHREVIGHHLDLREDERGLFFRAKIAQTSRGDEVLTLLKEGMLNGVSIGFEIKDSKPDEDKEAIRHLTKIKLWENSIVTFPSNEHARTTHVRSILFEALSTKDIPGIIERIAAVIDDLSGVVQMLSQEQEETVTVDVSAPAKEEDQEEDIPGDSKDDKTQDLDISELKFTVSTWLVRRDIHKIRSKTKFNNISVE